MSAASATLMLDTTDRLLGDLADAVPALRAVGNALRTLADGLGVEKVIVAVDDAALGRQVFCSGRAALGEDPMGLWGPAGAWTEPPTPLDDTAARLLVRAVGVGVVRAAAPPRVPGTIVPLEPAVLTVDRLTDAVRTATARSARHGWGFTLVLARGDAGVAAGLRPHVRAADTLVAVSERELALLLPETAGDRVPEVLARLAAAGGVAPFSFGLACCPADGTDPAALCATAAARLAEAERARVDA